MRKLHVAVEFGENLRALTRSYDLSGRILDVGLRRLERFDQSDASPILVGDRCFKKIPFVWKNPKSIPDVSQMYLC